MFSLLGGVYLGWALGANDASNVFGTAVGARIIKFRNAAFLCAAAVIAGAALQGEAGIHTLSGLTVQNTTSLLIVSVSAAITVTIMTFLKLPISTSQAMVGAITGIGLAARNLSTAGLIKIIISWIATPIGAMGFSLLFYYILRTIMRKIPMSILTRDKILWGGLIVVGTYGSYALGANNVANATGIYSGLIPGLSDFHLSLIGGAAIALGVVTFSRRVMMAVGTKLMRLDAFNALIAVTSMAVTTHIFSLIGVPVSTSQAIIGGIFGIGLVQGFHNMKFKILRNFGAGWLLTPIIALVLSAAGAAFFIGI
ncbi:MAG: inorganic phosphate transporter [Spirochaetales bacterium]|nr:inorganic phosphate transporter [Spirochaetales bacterium]